MDLDARREATLDIIADLHEAMLFSSASEVYLDASRLEHISDAAAVMLVAEMRRCADLGRRTLLGGNYPDRESEAFRVLVGLGAFEHLEVTNAPTAEKDLTKRQRSYFKIIGGTQVDGALLGGLIDHYARFLSPDPIWKKQIYRALVDAASNVWDHAYPRMSRRPYLLRQWWLAGLVNPERRVVRPVFLDQGVGIPRTMRMHRKTARMRRIGGGSQGRLIALAVAEGLSRHASRRRGHGLGTLKEMVDGAHDGILDILSTRGHYRYRRGEERELGTLDTAIGGTIIVWTLAQEEGVRVDEAPGL